jgi:hypothetical protein
MKGPGPALGPGPFGLSWDSVADVAEQWSTVAEIDAAVQRFTEQIPGWQLPAAYGVVFVPPDKLGTSEVTFPVVNVGLHRLPALMLGLRTSPPGARCSRDGATSPMLAS